MFIMKESNWFYWIQVHIKYSWTWNDNKSIICLGRYDCLAFFLAHFVSGIIKPVWTCAV